MFERYTERARRVIFFARYETSQLGGAAIETEHLLLGLIREGKGVVQELLGKGHLEEIRRDIEARTPNRGKLSTSVDVPLSSEAKRVLSHAFEEANRLGHDYIGTEHLLLGLMHEERSVAALILTEKGMGLEGMRDDILSLLAEADERASDCEDTFLGAPREPGREMTALDRKFLAALKIKVEDE